MRSPEPTSVPSYDARAQLAGDLRSILMNRDATGTGPDVRRVLRADEVVVGLLSGDLLWSTRLLEECTVIDLAVVTVRCAERARRTWLEYAQAPEPAAVMARADQLASQVHDQMHDVASPSPDPATGAAGAARSFAAAYVGRLREVGTPSPIDEVTRLVLASGEAKTLAVHATVTLAALLELIGDVHGRTELAVAGELTALIAAHRTDDPAATVRIRPSGEPS